MPTVFHRIAPGHRRSRVIVVAASDQKVIANVALPLDVATATSLVRIEAIEVTGDDGNRDGQRQDPCDGTRGADHAPRRTDRHLVSVSDGRHGDDCPPERVRDAGHLRVGSSELGVVDGTGEDEQRDEQSD